jgi:hypothetical protein
MMSPNVTAGYSSSRRPKPFISFEDLGEDAAAIWHEFAKDYDVILTTCELRSDDSPCTRFSLGFQCPFADQDLQRDLNVARPTPRRSHRATVDYGSRNRVRSPLILVEYVEKAPALTPAYSRSTLGLRELSWMK